MTQADIDLIAAALRKAYEATEESQRLGLRVSAPLARAQRGGIEMAAKAITDALVEAIPGFDRLRFRLSCDDLTE